MRASGILFVLSLVSTPVVGEEWKKHVVHEGDNVSTAIAADFNRDGRPDIISNSGGKTRLFLNPDWTEVIIDENAENDFIHSEVYDVDGDGDPDFIGARYSPGRVVWLECPEQPQQRWRARVIDETVNGIHGLLKGDVDGDGRFDLIANSAQPVGEIPDSAVWFKSTSGANKELDWKRYVFADRDAPGLSHYFGFGDVDGDGRPDISLAAKGGPTDKSGKGEWFAWWQAGDDPTKPFKKHKLPGVHPGATNIQQADVNGDGMISVNEFVIYLTKHPELIDSIRKHLVRTTTQKKTERRSKLNALFVSFPKSPGSGWRPSLSMLHSPNTRVRQYYTTNI